MKLAALLTVVGAAIVAAAAAIYVTPSLSVPFFDDGDGPKIIAAGLGAGWALVGAVQAWRLGHSTTAKCGLALLLFLSVMVAGAIPAHALWFARSLPPPSALKAGDEAPAFSLPDQDGKNVFLTDFKGKRLIVAFHRGAMCPWCVKQLKLVQGKLADIRSAGGEVVFISADSVETNKQAATQHSIEFPLLADSQFAAIKAFGLLHVTELPGINMTLARPALFFINTDGTIAAAFQPDDFRRIFSADDVMASFNQAK